MQHKVTLKIDVLLKERNLTQAELSELTGVRQAAISQLARGFVSRVSINHLQRIIDALGIEDINELITITDTNV